MTTDPILHADGVGKTYTSGLWGRTHVHALAGLDLSVERGQTLGILGPNGAGKTTLLKLALGIVRPTVGRISLFGRSSSDPEARKKVGYLAENHRFPPHLTARQALDVYGRLGDVPQPFRSSRATDLLKRVDLSDWADRRISTFSKGMMQRLGLAQALLGDPELLILDEPTDGIDPVGRRQIRDLLAQLNAEGMTILINSHILSEVELMCERIVILRGGLNVWTGPVHELVSASQDVIIRTPESSMTLTNVSNAELNEKIDALRRDGVLILSVERPHDTLESTFIRLMEE